MENEILAEQIIDVPIGVNTSYILKNENIFYDIGFHVMKNQKIGSLLPCRKIRYNGKIKLVYLTEDKFSFQRFLAETEVENIYMVIHNLFHAIEEIQNNGFLNLACIDNRNNKIFIDKDSLEVKLVYLPIDISMDIIYKDRFDSEIRKMLLQELLNNRWAYHPKIQECITLLKNGGVIKYESIKPKIRKLMLQGKNYNSSFIIEKTEYKLGRLPNVVDGVIEGSPAIGRLHCKIIQRNNRVFIMDCGSTNGTFVNNQQLVANQEVEVMLGSKIRLANVEFELRSV